MKHIHTSKRLIGLLQLLLICFMLEFIQSCSFSKTVGQNNTTTPNRTTGYKPRKVNKAEDDVELVCAGDGKTLNEAVKMALRSGLEQTYGTFVSANTTILNDELIKDEIVSLSTGNVRGYEIVSKNQSSDGTWNAVVKAVFSTGKLVSYVKSKGGSTELAGGLFAMYAKMEKMNEEAEVEVINNLRTQLNLIVPLVYDYVVEAGEPQAKYYMGAVDYYYVPGTVEFRVNENAKRLKEVFTNTLQSLSLTPKEAFERNKAGLKVVTIKVYLSQNGPQPPKGRVTNSVLCYKDYQSYGYRGCINCDRAVFRDFPEMRNYKDGAKYESAIKNYLAQHQNVPMVFFLRTNTLPRMLENGNFMGNPSLHFILSDGINTKYAKDVIGSFEPYVMAISLLTYEYKKGTLVGSYNTTNLFTYKSLDELSKVKQITITPSRDVTK